MVESLFIKARVSVELKKRIRDACGHDFSNESAWLKRLVLKELQAGTAHGETGDYRIAAEGRVAKGRVVRVYVRLRADDWALLEARATARGMRPATYLSALTRSHLRRLAPLPKDELLALKKCLGELGMLGRNLNQLARAANAGVAVKGSAREEFGAMLKICEALRESTKALVKRNLESWESGVASVQPA